MRPALRMVSARHSVKFPSMACHIKKASNIDIIINKGKTFVCFICHKIHALLGHVKVTCRASAFCAVFV